MFFIKLAFWLGVIVLLMPTDAQQQARLYTTATAAVERATTFCDRNAKPAPRRRRPGPPSSRRPSSARGWWATS